MPTNFATLRILSCLIFFSLSVYGEQFPEVSEAEEAVYRAKNQARAAAYKEYSVYLCDLKRSFASEMEQAFNLHCAGGGGQMHGKIKQLSLDFYADRRATVAEARALHLLVLEKYVEAINRDERLRPFLKTYPFKPELVEILLTFRGINGVHADGSVKRVWNFYAYPEHEGGPREHLVLYSAEDPTTRHFVDLLEEPYEEALRQNALAPVENPAVHPVTAKEESIDQLLLAFRKQMYEKHGLECWSIGGDMQGKIDIVGAKFIALGQATQEEARWLLLDIAQSFVTAVNEQPELRPYFHDELFSADRLRLRLCFKTEKYGTYKNGSMESVMLEGGQVTYFQIKPRKKGEVLLSIPSIVPVYAEESYEEALQIMENAPPVKKRHKIFSMWLNFF